MRKKISILILLSSFISSITFSTVRSETDTTSILVLNSYHHGYQWTDDVLEGFLSQFPENDPSLEIRIEYMDTKHYNTPDYFELLKKVYHSKYKDKKINLIVVTDNAALYFIKRHRRELFPDIPVVFCGINQFSHRISDGTKADSISIVHVGPKRPVFDYLMMQRFEIDESNLPPDAILINKSFSLYNLIRPL